MIHQKDDNGDALRRLEAEGDDLGRARNIDFTVNFLRRSYSRRVCGTFS
jgi:hypothetical protein